MKCSKCNAEIADNAKFCPKCGAKVEKVEPTNVCPNCGNVLKEGAKFCTKCGTKIGDSDEKATTVVPPAVETKNDIGSKTEAEQNTLCSNNVSQYPDNATTNAAATQQYAPNIPDASKPGKSRKIIIIIIVVSAIISLAIIGITIWFLSTHTYTNTNNLEYNINIEENSSSSKQNSSTKEKTKENNKKEVAENFINGHEYVDLGLPSGILWATCNIGANSPTDFGSYFSWGEIHIKGIYNNDTYDYQENPMTLPIYADAATAIWGESWRIPTKSNCDELIKNCRWDWTMQNGQKGYIVTGPNGKSIFFPAAGNHLNDKADFEDSYCLYWTSSYISDKKAWYCEFCSDYHDMRQGNRYLGLTIRPVCFRK